MSAAYPGVVVKVTTDVADSPILLRSDPSAYLTLHPIAHRGDAPEFSVAKILKERSEVLLDFFSWVPSALESLLDVGPEVEVVPSSEFIGMYAHGNQSNLGLFP